MGSKRKRGAKESSEAALNGKKRSKHDRPQAAAPTKVMLEKLPFVETPVGDERKREATLYELLGSEDGDERIEAADCIISGLLAGDGVPEVVLRRHLERRLFRGLASGRNASRLGFSLVITEILGQLFGEKNLQKSRYPDLTFATTLGLLVDNTEATGNIPGQEERDYFFGQLFGVECFVRARILFADNTRWNTVLDLLLRLGSKKIWLRSQCGWIIVQALEQMTQEDAELTLKNVAKGGMAMTPEGIAIWLVALKKFPELNIKPWRNPLAKKSLPDVAAILKESFQDSSKEQGDKNSSRSKQPNWTAQLHFVWDIILSHYLREGGSTADEFDSVWTRVVDGKRKDHTWDRARS